MSQQVCQDESEDENGFIVALQETGNTQQLVDPSLSVTRCLQTSESLRPSDFCCRETPAADSPGLISVCPAGSRDEESSCGRPLGIRVGPNGTLFVADAYLGVFEVNPTTGELLLAYRGLLFVGLFQLSHVLFFYCWISISSPVQSHSLCLSTAETPWQQLQDHGYWDTSLSHV